MIRDRRKDRSSLASKESAIAKVAAAATMQTDGTPFRPL